MPDRTRLSVSEISLVTALLSACCLTLGTSQSAAALQVAQGTAAGKHLTQEAPVAAFNLTDKQSWPPVERIISWIVEKGGEVRPTSDTWHDTPATAHTYALCCAVASPLRALFGLESVYICIIWCSWLGSCLC